MLGERSIDHVVLERGEIANSWRRERWESLRLLTPNFQCRLPGFRYDGDDPEGYMSSADVAALITRYAEASNAPVRTHTEV
ncbi:MAG: NAD(P)-binding domain-containing protein, partial [Gammaproteobacteria bacterium]